jgi:hypothetical protein
MKRVILFLMCIFCTMMVSQLYAQTPDKKDSSAIKESFTRTMYGRFMPLGIYTGAGYPKNRITQNIEIGKSFGMIDAGLVYGKTAIQDTAGNGTNYLEAKVTMDVCQYGIFSNEMTIGAGGVFNSKNYLMLEISYTIYGQFWDKWGIGIITGFYDFSGNTTDASHNMFGLYLRYGLPRPENGGLINIGRMTRTHLHR